MASLSTAARRVGLTTILAVLFGLLFASPAAAHAELMSITPENGAQLAKPPTEIRLTFTESVNLVEGGIRLVDHVGATVPTPDPTLDGRTVTWRMPADLPEGPYVVTWRVVSADGHPVSGASSFGVGTAAAAVPGSATTTGSLDGAGSTVTTGSTVPWPVIAVRLAGYVAFALFVGVVAFVLFCAPDAARSPILQVLARVGLIGGVVTTGAAMLVQGPYAAGVSMGNVFDTRLLQQTLATPSGTALIWRLALYGVLGVLAWRLPRILTELASWLVPAGVAGLAVTIAMAGHAAAAGLLGICVDALHALTAGLWVGGLLTLAVLGRSVEPRALHKFSTLALASVLVLVATGTLNSLRHLDAVEQLWRTGYGLTLMIKLILVVGAFWAAAVSRRRLHQLQMPLRSVRFEAALTVAVFAVTAVLSMTAPPSKAADPATGVGQSGESAELNYSVKMSLGQEGAATLAVLPATTAGSHLHLVLTDTDGRPLSASRVTLKIANPGRHIAPMPVTMTERSGVWVTNYRFPFPGTWKAILTVDGIGASAVVTSGDITIRE